MLDLRPHSGELGVKLALFHLEFGLALNRAWGIVVAVADEHAIGDRVVLDFRFFETLLSRGFGGGRGVPFVLDPIAVGSRNKARLLQMVAASLGSRGLRRFRARGLKLRRLSRKSRVDQLEAAGAVFFGLKGDRVERGLRQLGLAPKRLLLRLQRVQVAPKLVEAASIGIGVADREFGRRGARAPIYRLLSRRLDDAFDGRTDRLDAGLTMASTLVVASIARSGAQPKATTSPIASAILRKRLAVTALTKRLVAEGALST